MVSSPIAYVLSKSQWIGFSIMWVQDFEWSEECILQCFFYWVYMYAISVRQFARILKIKNSRKLQLEVVANWNYLVHRKVIFLNCFNFRKNWQNTVKNKKIDRNSAFKKTYFFSLDISQREIIIFTKKFYKILKIPNTRRNLIFKIICLF